ncbi:type IV secretion system protein [Luteibacter sp.]|jgi:type IV secretion system protein VirB6|uniref:type IV secretion system protein n=1 Tax=Luteibacter sp. TaxID=1886636 RepID=UPI002F4211CD
MFQDVPVDGGGAADNTRVAHFLLDGIVDTITQFAQTNSQALIDVIARPAVDMMVIYVLLWGAGIASGQIQEPFGDGIRRILRIITISLIGLTASDYQGVIVDFFVHAPAELASTMISTGGGAAGGNGAANLADILDNSLSQGLGIAGKAWDMAESLSIFDGAIGYYLIAMILYLVVAIIVAIATGIVFVTFISLALLLAVGPFFILMAIFQATQRFFEAWLGQVVSMAILFLLVASAVSLCFSVFDKFVTALPQDSWEDTILNMVKVLTAAIAIITVLWQTQVMAAALGQGIALSAQQFAGRIAGSANRMTSRLSAGSSFSGGRQGKGGLGSQYGAASLNSPLSHAQGMARKTWSGS